MEVPVTGKATLSEGCSSPHLTEIDLNIPDVTEDDVLIAQLAKTSGTQPQLPSAPSSGNRRKIKPTRFEISRSDVQKEHPPSKFMIQQAVSDPPSPCLSLGNEKIFTKVFKTQVPAPPAMIRAVEIQSKIGMEFPSCIKMMVKSQVACGFWMGLPLPFSRLFLPKDDVTFILEDECGKQWEVKYIAYKSGLSAGWKMFAINHNLVEGDVLVFHLVESVKFKVYILKANDTDEADGALSLMNPVTPSPKTKRSVHPESLSLTLVQKKQKKSAPSSRSTPPTQLSSHRIEHSGNASEEVGSEVLEASRFSKAELSFQEVKTFEDFHIVVKGLCIDRELPDDVRMCYYKLCLDKKQFLHDVLRDGMYYKLVAGMIGETVTIANKIKNCELTTTKEEFDVWDNILKSFELLGMKVGFLRDRVHTLVKLAFESEGASDIKKYVEWKNKKKQMEDEMKKVAAKLSELKKTAKKFERSSSSLKKKAEKYEHKFHDEVDAPW